MPNPFGQLTVNTTKGQALHAAGVAAFRGNYDYTVWNQTGVAVDRDTLTVDGQVFEFVSYATDSTFDVLTFWNNTDAEVSQTLAAHTFVVGDYVVVNSEVAKVTYVSGDVVGFKRGVAGSTIVAHATGTDPILYHDGTALTAGAITVPLDALTAENTIDRTIGIMDEMFVDNPRSFLWETRKYTAAIALIVSRVAGSRGATVAEAMTNGTLLPTTTEGGNGHQSHPVHCVYRAPTAAEVTAGSIYISVPFKPVHCVVTVFDTAAGATKAWDGAISYNHTENVVEIDNSGVTDWAADDFLGAVIFGQPQDALTTFVSD